VGPGSTLVRPGSRTNGVGKHRSPHKTRQPWVPVTSFRFCVRGATRPNCQPLTLSHLESDGGPTVSMPAVTRPHCILPARNSETLTIFSNFEGKQLCPGSSSLLWPSVCYYVGGERPGFGPRHVRGVPSLGPKFVASSVSM